MSDQDDRILEEQKDRVAAWLLGSADPAERAAVEQLLADSPMLREYADWLRAPVDLLPQSVEQHSPPAALKRNLMTEVRRDAARSTSRRTRVAPLQWLFRRPAFAATAATAAIAAALGGYLVAGDSGPEQGHIVASATDQAPAARGTLVRTGDSGRLDVATLPPLERGRVYQLWVRRENGRVKPAGVFVLKRSGAASAGIPGGLNEADEVLVTDEPDGGSPQPTTPVLMRVQL